jgi:hypothetical protein
VLPCCHPCCHSSAFGDDREIPLPSGIRQRAREDSNL